MVPNNLELICHRLIAFHKCLRGLYTLLGEPAATLDQLRLHQRPAAAYITARVHLAVACKSAALREDRVSQ